MTKGYFKTVLDIFCSNQRAIRALLGISVVFFAMMMVSLLVVEPGSATYVISVVNMVTLAVIAVGCLLLLFRCRRRILENDS